LLAGDRDTGAKADTLANVETAASVSGTSVSGASVSGTSAIASGQRLA
jgi:hypothetical protein